MIKYVTFNSEGGNVYTHNLYSLSLTEVVLTARPSRYYITLLGGSGGDGTSHDVKVSKDTYSKIQGLLNSTII